MSKKEIYLDNAATTKVAKEVLEEMIPYLKEKYGNASSLHKKGEEVKKTLEDAREIIAKSINAKSSEIIFTSGGTESNNFAIKGLAFSYPDKKHIITTKIEHSSILNVCKWLEENFNYNISYLDVDKEGFVNPLDLEKAITKETLLFSCIHGNNEIGTIQNIEELGKICKKYNIFFHTDACQSYTKVLIDVKKQNLDLVTLNSHKIHGPKGVGALYVKDGIRITPLLHGGGQEKNLRSSTENIASIVGFAKASQIITKKDIERMSKLRDYFIEQIEKNIPNTKLNGPRGKNRLCNNINISFLGVEGESIVSSLNLYNIYVSTGSACSSNTLKPSHVLKAINCSEEEIASAIRFSISKYTKKEEIDYTLKILEKVIRSLRKISPLTKFIEKK
ncbi:MAG: cysteine desulfurase family protein [Candidatus Pacearchaeota archaeon]